MNEAWDHGLTTPVVIESIEAVRGRRAVLIRARSREGAMGVAVANQWFDALESLFTRRVVPFFIGKDATGLATLIDDIYRDQSNYKLSGMPFWACVAWAEFALLDLLGRAAGRSVAQMAGGPIRQRIAIYLSSMRRDTTPEQEVERFARRIRETGAKAIKLKIGGRMSGNADASSGRTEALVRLARQTLGDSITI